MNGKGRKKVNDQAYADWFLSIIFLSAESIVEIKTPAPTGCATMLIWVAYTELMIQMHLS